MSETYEDVFKSLTPIQRDAVNWNGGSVLVLAGPGAGKTRVLTTRVIRLLKESSEKRFKILALTFTTKAATEMRERVESLLPPGTADERTFIGTFHAFCTQILRQHGSHIGIHPDFGIYGQKADREAILADGIREAIQQGKSFSEDTIAWLSTIDELKSKLVTPEKAANRGYDSQLVDVYKLYEEKMRAANAMDFNGLLLETCKLLAQVPAIATRIRTTYPFWMLDEFQDTSPAQYWVLHYLRGGVFNNIFVVADDDQIIYQWAGASYRQIEKFRSDYKPALIQLVENHRCPPQIVEIANLLVAHNTQRTPEKIATIAARKKSGQAIELNNFDTDEAERNAIADEIVAKKQCGCGRIAVLARTRALLEAMLTTLQKKGVNAALVQRRDNFISTQFVWLEACLDQVLRPTNRRVFALLVNSANRFTGLELDPLILLAEAEATGSNFLDHWANITTGSTSAVAKQLGTLVKSFVQSKGGWKQFVKSAIPILLGTESVEEGAVGDASEDHTAWLNCMKEIRAETGQEPDLPELVQGFALRSKEPPLDPNAVGLLTIHTSKGLEFDCVYVIGLAEGEMPSWQSIKKGDSSQEMEEERRSCFVAVTRTKETLHLSYATTYRGYAKKPSRFLEEMSLIDT